MFKRIRLAIKNRITNKISAFYQKLFYTLFPGIPEEPEKIVKQREAFYQQFISEGDLVFDIGANYGNRTRPFLNLGAKVIAVEPQKKCCAALKKKFGDLVVVLQMGVGEKEELKDFYISNVNVISSFSKDWIKDVKNTWFKNYKWRRPIKVRVNTLDYLINIYGLPKFIKIDVEGFEIPVLKGLSHQIPIISFEYSLPTASNIINVLTCLDILERINGSFVCNYSVGEDMSLVFNEWVPVLNFKEYIQEESFLKSGLGDIYIKYE